MQRYSLNNKGGTYTQGSCYTALPIYRQQVVPGQTVNLDAEISIKTAAFTTNLTTPCVMSTWFFYVPHRLSWDEWPSFISKEINGPDFPVSTTAGPYYFDGTGTYNRSTLYRRAAKLCYNEYLGTENITNAWFADPTDDTDVSVKRTRTPDSFLSKLRDIGEVSDPEFAVTANSIPLNEFYRSMMNARSDQRSQMTGNKNIKRESDRS